MREDRLILSGALRPTRRRRGSRRPRIPLALAGLGLAALGFATLAEPAPRLVWNASASAPVGLYWVSRSAPARGDLVLATLPPDARRLAAERGYLPVGVPLVKRLVAVSGDVVCAVGDAVFINGRHVAKRRERDPSGRALPRWTGCRVLAADEVFLLMAGVSGSFDGRYFGPVRRARIIGRLVPLWTG
jgi:conjugative transfer signal peptidase TraF